MEMVLRRGLMERSTEEVTFIVKSRVKVILVGLTRVNTLVIFFDNNIDGRGLYSWADGRTCKG